MYKCMECNRRFKTTRAAEKASYDGCPKCGGVDVDLDVDALNEPAPCRQDGEGDEVRQNRRRFGVA